jgi:predicted N-acetyltransferase YhbS
MMQVRIREASAADDDRVGELLVTSFIEQYAKKLPDVRVSEARKAELRDVRAKRDVAKVWVAEYDGLIVGTVALWPMGAKGSEAWISNACDLRHLAVAREARGLNVSSALLDTAEAWARQSGATSVTLHVRRGAAGVRALYERRGYERREEGDLDLLPDIYLEAFELRLSSRTTENR